MRQRLLTSGSFCCVGKRERNNKTLSKYCVLECREAAVGSGEGGGGSAGRLGWDVVLHRVARLGFTGKVTFEYGREGSEGVSHAHIWGEEYFGQQEPVQRPRGSSMPGCRSNSKE